jgi:hypothetical protein
MTNLALEEDSSCMEEVFCRQKKKIEESLASEGQPG